MFSNYYFMKVVPCGLLQITEIQLISIETYFITTPLIITSAHINSMASKQYHPLFELKVQKICDWKIKAQVSRQWRDYNTVFGKETGLHLILCDENVSSFMNYFHKFKTLILDLYIQLIVF